MGSNFYYTRGSGFREDVAAVGVACVIVAAE